MSTEIYKSVRKSLFTNLRSHPAMESGLHRITKLLDRLRHSTIRRLEVVQEVLEHVRSLSGLARAGLCCALVMPGLFILLAMVVLPVVSFKAPVTTPEPGSSAAAVAALDWQNLADEERGALRVYQQLAVEEAWLSARTAMGKGDSVALSISLPDSVINLEIRGVVVRECRIQTHASSEALRRMPANYLLQLLSAPFTLETSLSTTERIPIVIKKAPRDTVEAARMAVEPVAPEKDDVFFALIFNRGLQVEIAQVETPGLQGSAEKAVYDVRRGVLDIKRMAASLLRLQPPNHPLWLRLTISQDDARAIYRALPLDGQLALRVDESGRVKEN